MPRKPVIIFALVALVAVLVLTACGGGATTIPTASTSPTEAVPSTDSPAAVTEPDYATSCTAVSSIFPTPEPTEAAVVSLFPPVNDSDWILGEQTAAVTFLEYSDFQ